MVPIFDYHTAHGEEMTKRILNRSQLDHVNVQETVDEILLNVRKNGDKALFDYTLQFDKVSITADSLSLSSEEIAEAYTKVSPSWIAMIQKASGRIRAFHEKQKINSWLEPATNGEMLGQLIRPLERVGVYVPGGKAAYPSSVLMNVIPAQVAGVKEIIMVTPPQKDGSVYPETIVAAIEAGVGTILKIGGAQAIAALAYGTESIQKVDKICGPGNIYVALAKKSVYGHVNIDSVAGPSEILVLADETANPTYVAADMLSQAEHDELASAILITTSRQLGEAVQQELIRQTELLSRKVIIEKSLANYGAILLVSSMEEACVLSNSIAPEHMEVCTASPFDLLPLIQNAGAIFLGQYTPEPLGDYMAGPNHVLPTGGTARFFSPLSIDDFIKKSSILSFSSSALAALSNDIIDFANSEGLTAHANAISVRNLQH